MKELELKSLEKIYGGNCFSVGFLGVLEMAASPWAIGGPIGVYNKYKYPVGYCWNS